VPSDRERPERSNLFLGRLTLAAATDAWPVILRVFLTELIRSRIAFEVRQVQMPQRGGQKGGFDFVMARLQPTPQTRRFICLSVESVR